MGIGNRRKVEGTKVSYPRKNLGTNGPSNSEGNKVGVVKDVSPIHSHVAVNSVNGVFDNALENVHGKIFVDLPILEAICSGNRLLELEGSEHAADKGKHKGSFNYAIEMAKVGMVSGMVLPIFQTRYCSEDALEGTRVPDSVINLFEIASTSRGG